MSTRLEVRRAPVVAAAFFAAATLGAAASLGAQTYVQEATYRSTGNSVWGTSRPQSTTYSFRRSLDHAETIGGIAGKERDVITPEKCVGFVCFPAVIVDSRTGTEYRSYTKGSFGFEGSAKASRGTIDLDYRAQTGVRLLTGDGPYKPGQKVTLAPSWAPIAGSRFTTTSPSFELNAKLDLALRVGATEKICGGGAGCTVDGGDFFNVNVNDLELSSLNWSGTTGAKLLGAKIPGALVGVPVSPGDLNLGWTQAVDLTFYNADVKATGAGIETLTGAASANLLRFAMDPVKLALDYTVPGGSCIADCYQYGFGYDLAANRFGPTVGVRQDFEVTAAADQVTYEFSAPVQWRRTPFWDLVPRNVPCAQIPVPGACMIAKNWKVREWALVRDPWSTAAVSSVTLPVGHTLDILYPETGGAGLTLSTQFHAAARVHNTSRLRLTGSYDFDLLKVTTPGGTMGPVYDRSFNLAGTSLPAFFDQWLDVPLGWSDGVSFGIGQAFADGPISGWLPGETDPPRPEDGYEPITDVLATPEPASLALLAAGLLGVLAVGRRRAGRGAA